MTNYKIEVNAIQTMYTAKTAKEALQAYAQDAGYNSIESLSAEHPDPITVTVLGLARLGTWKHNHSN